MKKILAVNFMDDEMRCCLLYCFICVMPDGQDQTLDERIHSNDVG